MAPLLYAEVPFRFDAVDHIYTALDGEVLPGITGMLLETGHVDDTWFTEESSIRGTEVHRSTALYDLGGMEVDDYNNVWRAYFLAHVKAIAAMRAADPLEFLEIEQTRVHPFYRFAGRPDRAIRWGGRVGPLEIKTTDGAEDSHQLQTALQAILLEPLLRVPAEIQGRWALYAKKTGRARLYEHTDTNDIRRAREIIREVRGI